MNTSSIDTIVLGGGVVGTSIAYFLARRGQRVALVERGVVGGEGATRFSGGIVRGYDPDPFLGKLSALGSAMLASWDSMGMPGRTPLRKTGFCLPRRARRGGRRARARGPPHLAHLSDPPGGEERAHGTMTVREAKEGAGRYAR